MNIPPDFMKAREILEQLSKSDSEHHKKIAQAFLSEKPPNEPSEKYTIVIKGLCDNHNAFALTCVAKWYFHGIGIDANREEAVRLFKLAADQGYALAQNNLGVCYYSGFGVGVDSKEAVRLYKLAEYQGNAKTIHYLLSLSNVRKAIRNSGDYYYQKKLQKWIQKYVKRIIVRRIVLETWIFESVTR